MKFILGHKSEMTQKFAPDGQVIPVTKVIAGPCVVTQIKTAKRDGYTAVQLGFGRKKHLTKPLQGHFKQLGSFQYAKEFPITEDEAKNVKVGDTITVNIFTPGDVIKVTGTSKGKGFQGVVKRHGFHGSPASHGHKDQSRMPGSIGATGPAHVFKGTRMGGHMGAEQVSVTNLEVVAIDAEKQELFIKGGIPGPRGGLVLVIGPGELKVETAKAEAATVEPATEKVADTPAVATDQAEVAEAPAAVVTPEATNKE